MVRPECNENNPQRRVSVNVRDTKNEFIETYLPHLSLLLFHGILFCGNLHACSTFIVDEGT